MPLLSSVTPYTKPPADLAPLFDTKSDISENLEIPARIAAGAMMLSWPTGVTMPVPETTTFPRERPLGVFDVMRLESPPHRKSSIVIRNPRIS